MNKIYKLSFVYGDSEELSCFGFFCGNFKSKLIQKSFNHAKKKGLTAGKKIIIRNKFLKWLRLNDFHLNNSKEIYHTLHSEIIFHRIQRQNK